MYEMTVKIPASKARTCDIVIGHDLFGQVAQDLGSGLIPGLYKLVVVTDQTVQQLYSEHLLSCLKESNFKVELLSFPAGEGSKTRETKARLEDEMAILGCGRDTCILALGGGVVTDLSGYLAATYMRGIPYINLPTTLLSAADASIGGKTGVDTSLGKNLIGTFHHPERVYIDIDTWKTLPAEQIRNGLAETVKHAAILDAEFFAYLETHASELSEANQENQEIWEHIALTNVRLKNQVVEEDPKEKGKRLILNFGHTMGHALETFSSYSLLHGFAVSLGMVYSVRLGEKLGYTEKGTAERLTHLLETLGLPIEIPADVDIESLIPLLQNDKKARAGQIQFVLLDKIGKCRSEKPSGRWTLAVAADYLL